MNLAHSSRMTNLIDQLRTLRDELRVKAHLAGQDAKDAWKRLQPRARKLEGAGRKMATRIRTSLVGLRERLRARHS